MEYARATFEGVSSHAGGSSEGWTDDTNDIPLAEVDAVRIRLIMDNSIDILLAGTPVARRLVLGPNPFERPQPIAEHGFSALIEVEAGERHGMVLFDTGISRSGILYNMDAMKIDARDIQALSLIHI